MEKFILADYWYLSNSSKEVDKYINKGYFGTFYRQEDYINAAYLQFFNEY